MTTTTLRFYRWRGLLIAVVATAIVIVGNDALSRYFASASSAAVLTMLLVLPLVAIVTRPVGLRLSDRTEPIPVLGLAYAIRTGSIRFLVKSVAVWIALMVGFEAGSAALYTMGGIRFVAMLSNWLFVTSGLFLLVHLLPGASKLPSATPVSLALVADQPQLVAEFIALIPADRETRERNNWTVQPSDDAAVLTTEVLGGRQSWSRDAAAVLPKPIRVTVSRRRPWSQLTGVMPVPVDFLAIGESSPAGFVILVDGKLPDERRQEILTRHLDKIRNSCRRHSRLRRGTDRSVRATDAPVALVIVEPDRDDKFGRLPLMAYGEETADMLRRSARRVALFRVTAAKSGELASRGQLAVMSWLIRRVR